MTLARSALLALAAIGCAASSPPSPPPFSGAPPGPPEVDAALETAAPPFTPPPARPPPAASSATPDAPAPPAAVALEAPYPFGRPPPAGEDVGRWNQGGVGTLVRAPPPPEGHPMPHVIIDVVAVRGPHRASDLQRDLRRTHWIDVVRCYSAVAYREPTLRGDVTAQVNVTRSGKLASPRLISTTLSESQAASCMTAALTRHTVPTARAGSVATIKMHVSPGDDPIAPPRDAIRPAPGTLVEQEVSQVAAAALPPFEACYRRALEYAPELWGRLGARVHVAPSGQVDEAFEEETHFPDEAVVRCVLREARRLRFAPPTSGDARVVIPLRFGRPPADPERQAPSPPRLPASL